MLHVVYNVRYSVVESSWNVMAHGDAREGKWRGNWRMEWVASTLTLPRNVVYPALLPLMRTPRLPAVYWTDAPADLNGLVRFSGRRNPVSARVPSRFKRTLRQRPGSLVASELLNASIRHKELNRTEKKRIEWDIRMVAHTRKIPSKENFTILLRIQNLYF
jgi:hypothetical protein